MKILEKNLKEKIDNFKNKNVIIQFDELFRATLNFYSIDINYNMKNGMLTIFDKMNNNKITINITSVRTMNYENEILSIELDNYINFKIIKK